MGTIFRRTIIDEINRYLLTDDVIVLHGARQVGKTSILYYIQNELKKDDKTNYFIDLEDSRFVSILNAGVDEFIKHLNEEGFNTNDKKNKLYVFIDEIQYLKDPSSFLKLTADHHKHIKLILSGSSSFAIKTKFKDSLVGRTVNFEIFNLSFKEFLLFRGYHFEDKKVYTQKKIDELKSLFKEYVLYGGYPKIVLTPEVDKKEKYLQQIIDTYIKKDIRDLASIKDIDKFNKLLEALASQSGQLLNITELSNTTKIAKQTIEKYLFIMENTYILKLLRPFSKNIRSELFKLPKVYFFDTGLMQMLWLKGLQKEIISNVFETGIFMELVKRYTQNSVFYWRTKDKKEIDFILKVKNTILPIEVKLNFEQFNPSAVEYFNSRYGMDKYKVISLYGKPKNKFYVYPWHPLLFVCPIITCLLTLFL
ncbi:MAG: ATP-binding protein [Candidatus Brocadiaceae bacterium]|nr:ATP-binding protein [Candidatus Brocadiaceae bacterium]